MQDREAPRDLGELAIGGDLRRALAELRRRQGVSEPPEVDADRLHAVETAVGYRFADDLLATYAARLPLLAERFELTLERVVAHTGALAAAGAPGDLIGLGRRGEAFLCIEKRTAARQSTVLVHYRPDGGEREATPLLAWLEGLLGEAPAASAAADELAPKLVRKMPSGSSGRRVRHKVFGEGRVYVETGSGPERKVKVDFPGVGLKLLQARFLEFLDEE